MHEAEVRVILTHTVAAHITSIALTGSRGQCSIIHVCHVPCVSMPHAALTTDGKGIGGKCRALSNFGAGQNHKRFLLPLSFALRTCKLFSKRLAQVISTYSMTDALAAVVSANNKGFQRLANC